MPAKSVAQRRAMAIAAHAPEKLFKRNRRLASLALEDLRDFASTPEKDLPRKKRARTLARMRGHG